MKAPQRPTEGPRCTCAAGVVLSGSVARSTSRCFTCRGAERAKATEEDLFRIAREHGTRAAELRHQGYSREADEWGNEARLVKREAMAKRRARLAQSPRAVQ